MAIRSVPLDPAEVFVGTTAPQKILVIGGKTPPVATTGTFSHVQGAVGTGTTTSLTITLGAAPKAGNLVCIGLTSGVGISVITVVDGNGNAYIQTPNSPSTAFGSSGQTALFYLLSAPSNASATITVTWVTTASVHVWADEFSVSGGVPIFDKDVVGFGAPPAAPIANVNTPVISPTYSGSLLYAVASVSQTVTAPAANATLGVWTGSGGAITAGDMAEYDLNANGPTAVNFNTNAITNWASMAMSFYIAASLSAFGYNSIPIGPLGRSVVVEGVSNPSAIPVAVSFQPSSAGVNVAQLAGVPLTLAAFGVAKVGISGVTGVGLDGVITAAASPANGLATLAVNQTTAPSLAAGQSVAVQCDYVGSVFVKPYRRSQTASQATTITNSGATITVLAAQAAGIFADLSKLVIAVTPAATTGTAFTATLSDGTKSYIYDMDTGVAGATAIEGVPVNLDFNPPLPASSAATAWTVTLSVATVTVHITVVAALQKAS